MPVMTQRSTGLVRINGRVRGQINGIVIGEVHGIVRGEVNAIMEMGNMVPIEESDEYLEAIEASESADDGQIVEGTEEQEKLTADVSDQTGKEADKDEE